MKAECIILFFSDCQRRIDPKPRPNFSSSVRRHARSHRRHQSQLMGFCERRYDPGRNSWNNSFLGAENRTSHVDLPHPCCWVSS